MKFLAVAALAFVLSAASVTAQDADKAENHYYPRETAAVGAAHPWLVILPGGGGIDVFGDDHFYFDVAKSWNAAGFDVLVVHYQAAARARGGAGQSREDGAGGGCRCAGHRQGEGLA